MIFSDPDINAVKVSWKGDDCKYPEGDRLSRKNFVFVRASLGNFNVSGLDRYCRYKMQVCLDNAVISYSTMS